MKITIYELIGMVKQGKAPKKIKYKDKIYYYHKGYDFNYMYNSSDYSPMDKNKSLFTFNPYKMKDGRECWDDNTAIDFLNDEVEILEEEPYVEICGNWFTKSAYDKLFLVEEEKKIPEKLNLDTDKLRGKETPRAIDYLIESKINQVIDYLKSKGE